ncbi:MAG: Uma2 family endonuclease [Isosphaeraceae bacterium]
MATAESGTTPKFLGDPSYPTSDGRPIGESDLHFTLLAELVLTLRHRLAGDPMAYAGGNILQFYEQGNKRKHVSPDVFVTLGVPKEPMRLNYIPWLEGKAPDVIIEVTSRTTHRKDKSTKFALYRDVLKIPEYFLFDPADRYRKPSLQGFRLVGGDYVPIEPIGGRLPCESLHLQLGRLGEQLRL